MASKTPTRTVQCYHCRHRFGVSRRAESVSCPGCHKAVIVGDVVVDNLRRTGALQTCGRLVIKKSGRVMAGLIEAHLGVETDGAVHGPVTAGGPVVLGPHARWEGDLKAPALTVKAGARVTKGHFQVPVDALGVGDLVER